MRICSIITQLQSLSSTIAKVNLNRCDSSLMYRNRPRQAAEGNLGTGCRDTRIAAFEWCSTSERSEKGEKLEVILLLVGRANRLVVLAFVLTG